MHERSGHLLLDYLVGEVTVMHYSVSLCKIHMDLGDPSITFRVLLKLGIAQQIFLIKALPRCTHL